MPGASFAVNSFLGGEWSKWAQGRFERPDYRTALNVCLNMIPTEPGALTRRPGTRFGGTTRNGQPGRVIGFDFRAATPYDIEFTANKIRFWSGPNLATTNDDQVISSISTANPAVVTMANTLPATWATGDTVMFALLGIFLPLLQNRRFLITVTGVNTFSIADPLTGNTIDGSTLGVTALPAGATAQHIQELPSPYPANTWQQIRLVQTELQAILLHPSIPPQVITATPPTAPGFFATFAIGPVVFTDGPYLDPPTNGALLLPSATSGNITLTVTFAVWDATVSYALNAFVTQGNINYQSLIDQNLNNSPVLNPSKWQAVSAGVAIGPNGFVGTDIGRLMRIQDKNGNWTWGKIFSVLNLIAPATGTPIGTLTSNGGLAAAFDTILSQTAALSAAGLITNSDPSFSYVGKNYGASPQKIGSAVYWPSSDQGAYLAQYTIQAVQNNYQMQGSVVGTVSFVSGAGNGWTNGTIIVGQSSGAELAITSSSGSINSGALTGNQLTNQGFVNGERITDNSTATTGIVVGYNPPPAPTWVFQSQGITNSKTTTSVTQVLLNLRGKNVTAPSTPEDGTLLGQVTFTGASTTIPSNDLATQYQYVWIELVLSGIITHVPTNIDTRPNTPLTITNIGSTAITISYSLNGTNETVYCAEAQFYNPPGTGTGNAVSLQLFGAPLADTSVRSVWRLGTYSNTTGFPACGTYHEARLWLGGAVSNRLDGSQSGIIFNFAPTQVNGQVLDSSAISATFAGPDVNTIFWLVPDDLGIIAGTQAGDWLVRATQNNLPLTPSTIQAHRFSKMGCANIEPRKADHTLIIVQRWQRKLLEFFADVFSGRLGAQNLTWNARQLTKPGIAEIAYQQELAPIIWARNNDGSWFGITYKRESNVSANPPNFSAPHRHQLGSGRIVESIAVGPSVGGTTDTLAMVNSDPTTAIRNVEFLTDMFDEGNAPSTAWFLDSGVVPSSIVTNTANCVVQGLWHLNNRTVTVMCGGLDCGDWVVSNGSITMTYGDGISAGTGSGLFTQMFAQQNNFVVGFTQTFQGQIVRPMTPQETGARSGPALGKKRRQMQFGALLESAAGLSFGTDFAHTFPALIRNPNGSALTPGQLFSGVFWDALSDEWSFDSMLCWQGNRPYPATIVSVEGFIETSDK